MRFICITISSHLRGVRTEGDIRIKLKMIDVARIIQEIIGRAEHIENDQIMGMGIRIIIGMKIVIRVDS